MNYTIHPKEDRLFYILLGCITFFVGIVLIYSSFVIAADVREGSFWAFCIGCLCIVVSICLIAGKIKGSEKS